MDHPEPEDQEVLGKQREYRQDANLVRFVDLRADYHRQKGHPN
jgi:hypothetical protein